MESVRIFLSDSATIDIMLRLTKQMKPITEKETIFRDTLAKYGTLIRKVCYMYADSTADFEDLCQEALVNLWRGLDSFRGDSDLSTWIYRVTLNSCVSYFRSNGRHAGEPLESARGLVADDIDKEALLQELHRLINRLSRVEKAIILLWIDNYPYDTIAEIMAMPRNSVASQIHRIKEKLVKLSNQ